MHELRAFAEKTNIPVITTLLGLSAFPGRRIRCLLACLACMARRMSIAPLAICDLIIGVGLRFDDRVTGNVNEFAPNAQHHPYRHRSLRKCTRSKSPTVPIVADAKVALAALTEAVEPGDHTAWLDEIRCWEASDNRARAQY